MISTLVVTLGNMGEILVAAATRIMGDPRGITTFCVDWDADMDHTKMTLGSRIQALDQGDGVLVLTDILGGTPNNLSMAFAQSDKVVVVTGVNLPMLMKAMSLPANIHLGDAAENLCQQTRENIVVGSPKDGVA